jgi:hypothetical protein
MAEPLVALSIDLDAIDFYMGLYGLPGELSAEALRAVPGLAIERFGDLCASLGIPGTLFVVGRDLAAGHGRAELKAAAGAGHEIGNHSFSHDYALSRRATEDIEADLASAEAAIAEVSGTRPVGFRAPGYTLTAALLSAISTRGYAYDSSLLPSPPYYALKATVIGALAVLGKESRSILGPTAQLFRPRRPHRDPTGLIELPIAVVPGFRIPFYGTLLAAAPELACSLLVRTFAGDPLVVIELHGVDLCDVTDGIPKTLAARQRDLQIPAATRRRRVESALRQLLSRRRGVTLADAARLVSGSGSL